MAQGPAWKRACKARDDRRSAARRDGRAIGRGRAVSTATIRAKLLTVSSDAKWIIGAMGGLIIAVAGLLSAQINVQFNGLNTRIDELDARLSTRIDELDARLSTRIDELDIRLSARIDELRADVRELRAALVRVDERLDAVEVAVGRIDQRLATIERVVLPSPPAGG